MLAKIRFLILNDGALIAGAVQTVLALLSATVITLTASETGAILGVTSALLGLGAAFFTSPFRVSAMTGLTGAVVTLLVAYGVPHVEPSIVAVINAAITAIAALVVSARTDSVAEVRKRAAEAARVKM